MPHENFSDQGISQVWETPTQWRQRPGQHLSNVPGVPGGGWWLWEAQFVADCTPDNAIIFQVSNHPAIPRSKAVQNDREWFWSSLKTNKNNASKPWNNKASFRRMGKWKPWNKTSFPSRKYLSAEFHHWGASLHFGQISSWAHPPLRE